MALKALILIVVIAIVLTFVTVCCLWWKFPLPSDASLKPQYLEQYIGAAQVIGVGVVVTLLSVIIPLMLPAGVYFKV
ncbi:MAG: hypothetical protein EX341_19125 [Candidatus Scalindua sp. SCAELEC01]|nr:hypothetical protein [Planctomycetota bacterium]RZV60803.1 MAG: hypothetical protein EX341_19125 [Candidatus Scalindua sp. SCAELEC01]